MFMRNRILLVILVLFICLVMTNEASAGIFGEVSLSAGGIYPQGTFTRYADPGGFVTGRFTVHIPHVEFL